MGVGDGRGARGREGVNDIAGGGRVIGRRDVDHGARFGSDQGAGCPVPRTQSVFEVSVDPAGGNHAQIQRSRTDASDVADLRQDLPDQRALHLPAIRSVTEAGGQQRH